MQAVIDYGAGNIKSVLNALKYFNEDFELVSDADKVNCGDGIILPGVGNFGAAMKALRAFKLDKAICDAVKGGKPLLGICLGQQLLFESSEESPTERGLGIFKGEVRLLSAKGKKVPHIGWTSLDTAGGRLLKGIKSGECFYFVHSFAVHALERSICTGGSAYGESFDAVVEKDNVFGAQFHPEKSGEAGLKIIKNFIDITAEEKI